LKKIKEFIMEKELFICSKCGHAFETEQYKVENYDTEPYMVVICTCTNCGSKIFKKRDEN
jgi:DNA-directed RNA polymerase subunit RPC12/RpoP